MLRRSVAFGCLWMALMIASGCSWDSGLYEKFVNSEGEFAFCPTRDQGSETREEGNYLAYIVIGNAGESEDSGVDKLICCNPEHDAVVNNEEIECVSNEECAQYADSFKYSICPGEFHCNDDGKDYFCNKLKCTEGQILCGGKCIFPETDREYCGAKGNCSSLKKNNDNFRGVKCDNDMQCDAGTCSCLKGFIRCDEKCINPMNDMDYCGATDCSDEDNRGDNCYKLKHGGTIDNYCKDGKCVDIECISGYHLDNGICVEDDLENCGEKGRNCKEKIKGWYEGSCGKGECILISCEDGYHRVENICVEDSTDACGYNRETKQSKNCYEIPGFKKGECIEGKCVATDCNPGYHVYQPNNEVSTCETDNILNCAGNACNTDAQEFCLIDNTNPSQCVANCSGNICDSTCVDVQTNTHHCNGCGKDCNTLEKCSGDRCECSGGSCECKKGVYQNCGDDCIALNDKKNCGACGVDCGDDINVVCNADGKGNYACECQNSKIYNPESKKCVNAQSDANACGPSFRKCNDIANAKSVTCSNGKCVILQCKNGYHISESGDACVVNSPDSCGTFTSSSVANCNYVYWENARCNHEGRCVPGWCKEGGTLVNEQCVRYYMNSDKNCAAHDFRSRIDPNASTIYCVDYRDTDGYWGWEIFDCKSGYTKKEKSVGKDWCSNAHYVCHQEREGSYYIYECVKN